MRPNIPHFWKIMAHETREKRRRIARTPRATHPVCVRMSLRSVARIVLSRKMMRPSAKIRIFLGVRNVAHAPSTRNQYDAGVSDSAAYQETGPGMGNDQAFAELGIGTAESRDRMYS